MILNVPERLSILSILPKEGDYTTLKILRELRMSLSFTEEELSEWNVRNDEETGSIHWDTNGEAEIPVGEKAMGIIVDALRKLNNSNRLEEHTMDVYEKFIPTTE